MKSKTSNIILLFTVLILSACTTSKTTVSQNINLNKYEYASVINNEFYHIPAELMEYEIQLFDAVESSRLQLISDWRINELTAEQQSRLLLVKYDVTKYDQETVVTVNFMDFMTGRPVVSCRGSYALGMSNGVELRGAIKKVAEQISATFNK